MLTWAIAWMLVRTKQSLNEAATILLFVAAILDVVVVYTVMAFLETVAASLIG